MRSLMTFSLAIVCAAGLVHCTADGTERSAPPVPPNDEADSAAPAPDSDTSPDAGPEEASDAGTDAEPPVEAGACSADHWCRTPLPSKDVELRAVWSFGPDDAIAVGPAGAIQWNGTSWSVVPSPEVSLEGLTGLWATGPNDVWGTEESSTRIVHGSRTAPGAPFQWQELTGYSFPYPVSFLRSTGPRDLWGLARWPYSSVYLVHGVLPDAGESGEPVWTTTALPLSIGWDFTVNGFAITENKEVWVGGHVESWWAPATARVFHGTPPLTEDGAYTWEESLSTDESLPTLVAGIWALRSDDVWVISNLGYASEPITKPTVNYRRKKDGNGSAAWTSVPNNSSATAVAVWGSGKDDVWTVGTSGAIRRWNGTNWSTSRISVNGTPIFKDLAAIHGSSANDIWAVGNGIALHRAVGGAP